MLTLMTQRSLLSLSLSLFLSIGDYHFLALLLLLPSCSADFFVYLRRLNWEISLKLFSTGSERVANRHSLQLNHLFSFFFFFSKNGWKVNKLSFKDSFFFFFFTFIYFYKYSHLHNLLQMFYGLNIVLCITRLESCCSLTSLSVLASPEERQTPIKL